MVDTFLLRRLLRQLVVDSCVLGRQPIIACDVVVILVLFVCCAALAAVCLYCVVFLCVAD